MSALDSHAPYVLDTRELGRRPGTSQRVHRVLPAPEGLQVGLARVDPDAALGVDLLLEAVMEGVLVTLRTRVPYHADCARCLEHVVGELDVDVQEMYAHPDEEPYEDIPRLAGDLLDLEPMLRDAVVLALPAAPLCREDCPGLCPECGARLADEPDHAHHDALDPRWAALVDLTSTDDTKPVTPEEH
jgi:uncharacterized protein